MRDYLPQRQEAVALIESLRSGIPTRLSTRLLPDVRPYITEKIKTDLAQFKKKGTPPPGRLLWGQYGQGKTHALTAIEHLALDMGFAVSRVTLSREVSCHQLFPFYGRLATNLRLHDSMVMGLRKLLNQKKHSDLQDTVICKPDRYNHPLPRVVLEDYFYTEGEEQDWLYGDLTGTRLPLRDLRHIHSKVRQQVLPRFADSFKVALNAPSYIGLMADVVQWCGCAGWVILVDEIELLGRLGRASRLKAYQHLMWLLNWSETLPYPLYMVGAAANRLQDDLWYGGTARHKDDRELMPELAGVKGGKAAMAEIKLFFEKARSKDCPLIRPVHENELVAMLEELVRYHGLAYEWSSQLDIAQLLKHLGSAPIRTCVRATLEALDLAMVYGETGEIQAGQLQEYQLEEDEAFFQTEGE